MGCKSEEARLLLKEQQMQQRLMATQQQSDFEQQQTQQQLKTMLQQIHLEQLKWEEEAAVAKACLEAMSDTLCWGGFNNISADGLPTPAKKVGMLLSRNATSTQLIQSEHDIDGIPPNTWVQADPTMSLEPVSFQRPPFTSSQSCSTSIHGELTNIKCVQQASSVCSG